MAYFSCQKNTIFLTTITTHLTTISPSKNHVQHPTFSKTPSKNARKPEKNGSTGASDLLIYPPQIFIYPPQIFYRG
jgi:hypothetical protein